MLHSLGDWGDATGILKNIATVMTERLDSIEFVIALGDNFYFSGVESVDDPLWQAVFLKPFNTVPRPFYAVLGNHDWEGNIEAQLRYHDIDSRWNMENIYYRKTFKDGLLEVFFVDTTIMCPIASKSLTGKIFPAPQREEQYAWLEDAVSNSTATWKFICGHYPVHSNGENGSTVELRRLERLMETYRVDAYICGHDHSMQHHFNRSTNVHHFVSGAGSSTRYFRTYGASKHTMWQSLTGGYLGCDVTETKATFEFVSFKGASLYSYSIDKPVVSAFTFTGPPSQLSVSDHRFIEPHSPAAAESEDLVVTVSGVSSIDSEDGDNNLSQGTVLSLLLDPLGSRAQAEDVPIGL